MFLEGKISRSLFVTEVDHGLVAKDSSVYKPCLKLLLPALNPLNIYFGQ